MLVAAAKINQSSVSNQGLLSIWPLFRSSPEGGGLVLVSLAILGKGATRWHRRNLFF